MTATGLELLWYMKACHPDVSVRESTARVARDHVDALPWAPLRHEVRTALRAEEGTVLEPFVLEDRDVEDAVDLAVLAAESSRRLLVVSRDKLEPLGGLLVSLEGGRMVSHYVERRADAAEVSIGEAWRFAPGLLPAIEEVRAGLPMLSAQVLTDDLGHVLRASPFPRAVESTLPPRLELVGDDQTVPLPRWRIEWAMEGDQRALMIRPASPEDAIQLTALMIRQRWLVFEPGKGVPALARVAIRLGLPGADGGSALPAVRVIGAPVADRIARWLLTDNVDDTVDRFGVPAVVELGKWLGLVPGWEEAELLESFA